jgi:hypothetical protein
MGDVEEGGASFNITCPHCRKSFTSELIDGAAERYRGFKCPYCRLFVPAVKGEPEEPVSA